MTLLKKYQSQDNPLIEQSESFCCDQLEDCSDRGCATCCCPLVLCPDGCLDCCSCENCPCNDCWCCQMCPPCLALCTCVGECFSSCF